MKQIKPKKTDFEKISEFWAADPQALFGESYIAPVMGVQVSTLQNDRWQGKGILYRKISGRVLYRKSDVISYIEGHELVASTSQYKRCEENESQ
ncbi:MAG: DNA-binding protein [Gammaproteobacteria bacterium]